ncbi:MAG: phage tail protein [Dermatophilaceae bacterium]|nr:phage tail protein [Intrasporangiaceae bacterium]
MTPTTEEAYDALLHLSDGDEATDWTLLRFLDAMVRQLDVIEELVRDDDDFVGWGRLLDIDAVPAADINWLAQFVGVPPLAGADDETRRLRAKEAAGWKRGSPSAIQGAARQALTGTRRVDLYERDGSAYHFRVRTYLSETPDAAAVVAAVRALKPAGLTFEHEIQAGLTWGDATGTWAAPDIVTWADGANIVPT